MLEFVRENFRRFFVFSLWLTMVISTVGGSILGYYIGYFSSNYRFDYSYSTHRVDYNYAILGAITGGILGLLVGLLYIIIFGGLIATFLKIDANLQKLVDREEISRENESRGYGHQFVNDDNTELSYENWKIENPGKTINDYYASRRK